MPLSTVQYYSRCSALTLTTMKTPLNIEWFEEWLLKSISSLCITQVLSNAQKLALGFSDPRPCP